MSGLTAVEYLNFLILSKLSYPDLLRWFQTNRKNMSLSNDEHLWQIWLEENTYSNTIQHKPSTMSYMEFASRLEKLKPLTLSTIVSLLFQDDSFQLELALKISTKLDLNKDIKQRLIGSAISENRLKNLQILSDYGYQFDDVLMDKAVVSEKTDIIIWMFNTLLLNIGIQSQYIMLTYTKENFAKILEQTNISFQSEIINECANRKRIDLLYEFAKVGQFPDEFSIHTCFRDNIDTYIDYLETFDIVVSSYIVNIVAYQLGSVRFLEWLRIHQTIVPTSRIISLIQKEYANLQNMGLYQTEMFTKRQQVVQWWNSLNR